MANLTVRLIRRSDELRPLAAAWNALAGDVPFRAPSWQLSWWETYGESAAGVARRRELFVVAVFCGERLVGLAPWYLEPSRLWGRVVKQIGSGEVCSDYLTILTEPADCTAVVSLIAEFLCRDLCRDWDRLDLDGAVVDDPPLGCLVAALTEQGAGVERRAGPSCWKLALPTTFEEYLGRCSKSHRKQMRRLARDVLDTPRAQWRTAQTLEEFLEGWSIFIDLHQRRRKSLGESGCFQSARFTAFHEKVAVAMLARGALRLHWLEVDGKPLAAEYHLAAGDTVFGYQSGIDPDRLDEEPGRLAGIAVIRHAIEEGFGAYDLLRGDEPYKAHWRAQPTPTEQITVVAPRRASRTRHAVHLFLRRMKRRLLGMPPVAAGDAAPPVAVPESMPPAPQPQSAVVSD